MSSILNATTSSGLQIAPDNSGSLQLQTNNGTTALTIDTSQNVGIGTSSPTSFGANTHGITLDGTGNYQHITWKANGTIVADAFTNGTAGFFFGTEASVPLQFQTAATERMRIDSSGNVGIGTTSPAQKLNVVQNQNATTAIQIDNSNASTSARVGTIFNSDTTQIAAYATSSGYTGVSGWAGAGVMTVGSGSTNGMILNCEGQPIKFQISRTEAMRIDSSGYVQGTVNGLSAGRMQAYQYYRLNSGYAGSNATGAQSLFGVGVTLVGSTVYEFEALINLTKSAGTTSHTIALGFGGTATLNNIGFFANLTGGTTAATQSAAQNIIVGSSAASTVITGSLANATYFFTIIIKGTVSVNAGGTFIPQYTLSAAPGGAYTTAIGSYVKIAPLGASGANTNIGSWA